MRFAEEQFPNAAAQDEGFFITEDVRPDRKKSGQEKDQGAIEEERSYATEAEESQYLAKEAARAQQ